jgi:hypothetical protein
MEVQGGRSIDDCEIRTGLTVFRGGHEKKKDINFLWNKRWLCEESVCQKREV